jgi:hypothetical protein
MSITHNWKITRLDTLVEHNGIPNIVYSAFWQVDTKDSDHPYTVSQTGSSAIPYIGLTSYTPYASLTETQVLDMVKAQINTRSDPMLDANGNPIVDPVTGTITLGPSYFVDVVSTIEASGVKQLQEMITPTTVILPLPWTV